VYVELTIDAFRYITNGILFKFAQDQGFQRGDRTTWLYGRAKQNDGAAMKGAGHDLKGYFYLTSSSTEMN
jgi:hypothetical protein